MKYTLAAMALGAALPSVVAWGGEGHEAIAYVASNFISATTKSKTQKLLNDSSADWLANVATWADSYRYTSAGRWSEPLHFIDAQDSPPQNCSVDFNRDCGSDGCSISAMVNYTKRVTDESLSAADQNEALKFLVHFVGDIHQPLHDEKLEVGGNDIDVSFGSDKTNLHAVWDTNMIEKQNGAATLPNAKALATKLTTYIKTGNYTTASKGWTKGMNVDDAQGSSMIWAQDANTFVCSTVMPNGVSSVENKDLSGAYYQGAIPVIDELLARAGYRLAAWLNLIFTGSTGGL
jgi:S1/P1 Nuclease